MVRHERLGKIADKLPLLEAASKGALHEPKFGIFSPEGLFQPPLISRSSFEAGLGNQYPKFIGDPLIVGSLNFAENLHSQQIRLDHSTHFNGHVLLVVKMTMQLIEMAGLPVTAEDVARAVLHDAIEDGMYGAVWNIYDIVANSRDIKTANQIITDLTVLSKKGYHPAIARKQITRVGRDDISHLQYPKIEELGPAPQDKYILSMNKYLKRISHASAKVKINKGADRITNNWSDLGRLIELKDKLQRGEIEKYSYNKRVSGIIEYVEETEEIVIPALYDGSDALDMSLSVLIGLVDEIRRVAEVPRTKPLLQSLRDFHEQSSDRSNGSTQAYKQSGNVYGGQVEQQSRPSRKQSRRGSYHPPI